MKNTSGQNKSITTKDIAEALVFTFLISIAFIIITQLIPLIVGIFYIATTPSEMLIPLFKSIDYKLTADQLLKSVGISTSLAFSHFIIKGKLMTISNRESIKMILILTIIFCPVVKMHDHFKPAAIEHKSNQLNQQLDDAFISFLNKSIPREAK
ncbi:hypothetical protein SOX05_08800 [Pseudomonas putida]|nr:hypothetical protein [Pseudomonas putida]MDY4319360.1 hypothetical protein [Pseudomonas putida]MDY4352745.1 hypothetical protein [Pseudomonas putida]